MNPRFFLSAAAFCLLLFGGWSTTAEASLRSFLKKAREMQVRTTAYTHTEASHREWARKTAAGTTLKAGKVNSAAADWSFLPLGTTFRIKGHDTLYRVDDYGRALVGTKTIDIYRPSAKSMNDWGVRNVDIQIVKIGSVKKSIDLLDGRSHHAHCRTMLEELRKL